MKRRRPAVQKAGALPAWITFICSALGLFIFLLPSIARSQTSILEPFEFVAHVAVGTIDGRRPLSGAQVVLNAGDDISSAAGVRASGAGTPSGYSGSLRAIVRRDVDGELLSYQVEGEGARLPILFLQNQTRWVASPKPPVVAPSSGDVTVNWVNDGLCSVIARVDVSESQGAPKAFLLAASGQDWQSGFTLSKAETGAPAEVEGFVRSQVNGAPWLAGEFLAPAGITLQLSATVVAPDNSELTGVGTVSIDASDCPAVVTIEVKPTDDDDDDDEAKKGSVDAFIRLKPDSRVPPPLRPTQSFAFATLEGLSDGASGFLLPSGTTGDGFAKHSGEATEGRYELNVSTWVTWANGRSATLHVGRNAAPGNFSPMVPLPVSAGAQKGFYPDLSFALDEHEVETLFFDGQFLMAEGAIEPIGCVAPGDLKSGVVEWFEDVRSPGGSFVDEGGVERPTTISAGRASASFEPGSGRYRIPVVEGDWREANYSIRFERSGSTQGLPPLDADVDWTVPRSSMSTVSVRGDGPSVMLLRSLPFAAATVTLQVIEPGTGQPLPFRAPVVSVSGIAVPNVPPVRDWSVTARGANEMRTMHRVVVPSFPGAHDLSIYAYVAQDSSGSGAGSRTSFPTIHQVPFRAPRLDGGCPAICTGPDGVYWDDDMMPPSLEIDELPAVVRGPFLNVTGRVSDESPIVSVTAGGVTAQLDGDDRSRHREFSVRVPIDESMLEITFVARDRCGGETLVTRPIVWERNTPPVIEPIPVVYVDEGQFVSVDVTATDPDAEQHLAFTLDVTGLTGESMPVIDPETGTISWTPDYTQSGTWTFVVRVSDGLETAETSVVFEVRDINRPPLIVRVGGVPAAKQMTFEYEVNKPLPLLVEVIDLDGEPVSFAVLGVGGELPKGISMSPSGVLVWMPMGAQAGGEHVFDVTASDPKGGADRVRLVLREKGYVAPTDKALENLVVVHGGGFDCQNAGAASSGFLMLLALLARRRGRFSS